MTPTQNNPKNANNDFLRIQDLLYLCMNRWHWFVISVIVALLLGFFYVKSTAPTYKRSATIFVLKDVWGNSIGEMGGLADIGLVQNYSTVTNEIAVISSIPVVADVVKRLHLDVNYSTEGRFYNPTLYGKNCPIDVSFNKESADTTRCQFNVMILDDNRVKLSDFLYGGLTEPSSEVVEGLFSDTLVTPVGELVVTLTPYYRGEFEGPIHVSKSDLIAVARGYSTRLQVGMREEQTSIVDLTFTDVSAQRAEDFLNTLIVAYNDNWMKGQNLVAVNTSEFITERLAAIEEELGSVDDDISSFKSRNLMPDVAAVSSMYMSQSNEANTQIQGLNNQLYMAKYVRNYITNEENKNQLLPANTGLGSNGIETQIMEYNRNVLQRNTLVTNSSESNPLVKELDQVLLALRKGIISSIDNYIVTLNGQIESLQKVERKAKSQIAANPTQAKYLLSIERQQKVKESLYLFLLQKREETELSQSFTAYNARVVQPALGSASPSAPMTQKIMLVAFVLGLCIPLVVIYIMESTNTKIRGRKDLENSSLPFVGEVPLWDENKQPFYKRLFSRKKEEGESIRSILVKEGKRNVINEAFRVLRTNLEFMIGKGTSDNVIIFTSFNPGSGKTFLSINTAMSLALKGKRVLVVDGDLRHASTSAYIGSPKIGLSNYLAYRLDDIKDAIVEHPDHENLNILPVGILPPNPAELLEEPRFAELIESFRTQYDYVFIDCPPIDLVADTQIIARVADHTIFVVRAGLLERLMLNELESIYQAKKYKNMALILNGTHDCNASFNYGYSYGYRFGYSRKGYKY